MKERVCGILLAASLLVLISTPLFARVVDVDIISDQGQTFPLYSITPHNVRTNTFRAYVEAVRGRHYAIRVRNNTGHRLGLVIAVDGRNIISGSRSALRRDERMYILNPHAGGTFDGWRTAPDQVNRFYFTDAGDSYAGAWDDHSAMGVIAVAVFFEKVYHYPYVPPAMPEEKAGQRDSAESQPGTGFGEGKYSPSRRVAFEPEERPAEKHFLKYEWRETLCRKGFLNCRPQRNRFWDDDDFAPYPPRR